MHINALRDGIPAGILFVYEVIASWWYKTTCSVPHRFIDKMEKITFHFTPKKDGSVRVRYRLRDGRNVQICHSSKIETTEEDIAKFEPTGFVKGNIRLYNAELADNLRNEYEIMLRAYTAMKDNHYDMTTEVFEREIQILKNPQEYARKYSPTTINRFRQYLADQKKDGLISEARGKHIEVVIDKMERHLQIVGKSSLIPQDFSDRDLLDFRNFLFEEYLYVEKYPDLYAEMKERNKPKDRLSMNTVVSQLKMVKAFFNYLENRDEIAKSPFRKLGSTKEKIMKTKYDDPVYLHKDELMRVMSTEVPATLQDTKDAFLVQCAFGCRVSDFQKMGMQTIAVSDEGIPYIHYIPQKTVDAQTDNSEIQTPIVRFAFDIIKRTGFNFPILRNLYGTAGYNANIKYLLQVCKIERQVPQYNEEKKQNDYTPLYRVGSSKLCRKTYVDLTSKFKIDLYAGGMHAEGSTAVNRYTKLEIKDRFILLNLAFEQTPYKVDKELNLITK